MSTKITGQLWYTDGQDNLVDNGDEAGFVNSDGSSVALGDGLFLEAVSHHAAA